MQNLSILSKEIKTYNGLFCLNDLHKASGNKAKHKPDNFLRLDTTKSLVTELETENNHFSHLRSAKEVINGGKNRGTYVCKELVYHYAMWISAKFSLLVIRTFDQLQSQQQAKLESPYIEGKQLQHIKEGVKRIVNQTGKSYQTVYGGLNQMFGAPNINQIEKGYYERVCIYLDIPSYFEVPADKIALTHRDSRIKGLALMVKAGLAKTVQDRKIAIAESHIKRALAEIEAAKQYSGTIHDGIYEAKHKFNFSGAETKIANERAKKAFVEKFPLPDDKTQQVLGIGG